MIYVYKLISKEKTEDKRESLNIPAPQDREPHSDADSKKKKEEKKEKRGYTDIDFAINLDI